MTDEIHPEYLPVAGRTTMTDEDRALLAVAKTTLENPSFAARLADRVGKPVDWMLDRIPGAMRGQVDKAVSLALDKAYVLAARGVDAGERPDRSQFYKAAAMGIGAVGGFGGATTLAMELPAATVVMMRSIVDIARSMGEDPRDPETRAACLAVFALGGRTEADDAVESGYFAVRAALSKQIDEAVRQIATYGIKSRKAPAVARFLSKIAERFGVTVSEKAAAQSVPVLGAIGGATVNAVFMNHYQAMARGHFTVRMLERRYGRELVRATYLSLPD
jgi:hypothetical protein